MLIFWYDLTSPNGSSDAARKEAQTHFSSIVSFLEVMGNTWWAAAAKHKLGEALLRLAGGLLQRMKQSEPPATESVRLASAQASAVLNMDSAGLNNPLGYDNTVPYLTYEDDQMFWSSLGLDFEHDVAAGVYSIM